MNTLTEIANLALVEINKDPIKNLDEPSQVPNASSPVQKSAAVIRVVLTQVIDWIQSESRWSCLTVKETLSLKSEPTEEDPVYIYNYPDGVLLRIRLVSDAPYEVVGNTLRTHDPLAILWCTRRSEDPSQWNPQLTEATYTELAARIAPKLSESDKIIQSSRHRANVALVDAVNKDYVNRASARETGSHFGLNQARDGVSGIYDGRGRASRLRGGTTFRGHMNG